MKGGITKDFKTEVLNLSHELRKRGVGVTLPGTIDALRGVTEMGTLHTGDAYWSLKLNMVSSQREGEVFDEVYRQWLENPPAGESLGESSGSPVVDESGVSDGGKSEIAEGTQGRRDDGRELSGGGTSQSIDDWLTGDSDAPLSHGYAYSPVDATTKRVVGGFTEEQLLEMIPFVDDLAVRMAGAVSRRQKQSTDGMVPDLRRTLRRNVQAGGELLYLRYKKPKTKKTKIVFLCDVSGSMLSYLGFSFLFLQAATKRLRGAEVFLFSTKLERATLSLRIWEPSTVMARVRQKMPGWAGGTQIGSSLSGFLFSWGRKNLSPGTVVVIISDGWDTGEMDVLDRSLRELKSRSAKLYWLSPLAGSATFNPISRGMLLAVKHSDMLLPFHNLDSLRGFCAVLERTS
ncbi:MAG: vWA domain-containing protein [Thermoleophilia bacterium]